MLQNLEMTFCALLDSTDYNQQNDTPYVEILSVVFDLLQEIKLCAK